MKVNLIKRMTSLLLVTGTISTMSACGNIKYVEQTEANKELTSALSTDTDIFAFDTYYFELKSYDDRYFANFRVHYDEGRDINNSKTEVDHYENHQDYKIIYSISKDDYYTLVSYFRDIDNKHKVREFSEEQISEIKKIVDEYDATDVYPLDMVFYSGCRMN